MAGDTVHGPDRPDPPMLRYRLRLWLFSLWFAHVAAWFTGQRRRIRANLDRVLDDLPARERRRIARASARTIGRVYAEMASPLGLIRAVGTPPLEGPGVAALRAAEAEGRACIFASAHLANHFACIVALKANGIEAGILYREVGNRLKNRMYNRAMTRFDQPLLRLGRRQDKRYQRNLAKLSGFLRQGRHVGLLLDQRIRDGARLRFFGRRAWTSVAIADLALRHGAVMIPSRAIRQPDGISFRFWMDAPIPPTTPERMMQAYNDLVEAWIREHPEQWFWDIRRWG